MSQEANRPHFAIGPTFGTLGVGAEASFLVYDYLAVRAAGSYLTLDSNEVAGNFGGSDDSPTTIEGISGGVLLDVHPFADGWRLTAGARYIDVTLEATDTNGSSFGSGYYTAAEIGTANLKIKNNNSAAPYLGFGYDSAHYLRNGSIFSLSFELGALYAGEPDVEIITSSRPADAARANQLDADISAEKKEIEDDLKRFYWFYPVAMISGKLSF